MQTQARRPGLKSGNHTFSQIPSVQIPRSAFDRSHGVKTTFDAGWLVPVYVDEALPGDTFSMTPTIFGRLATPLHPIMDNLFLEAFFFAVPLRLIWDNFQKFMGEQTNPDDPTDFLVPQVEINGPAADNVHTLWDYLGLPLDNSANSPSVSAFWHRAYNLIWNEWFRDQNLQDSLPVYRTDGPDEAGEYLLQRRGKRHDYFTSSLPWPQKGAAVELPLGLSAPVTITDLTKFPATGPASAPYNPLFGVGSSTNRTLRADAGTTGGNVTSGGTAGGSGVQDMNWFDPRLFTAVTGATGTADLSTATAATINQIRQAFQIQKLYERDARGGTRYTEILRSHFGVISPDARLQRPEYLGGGSTRININPVAQTSSLTGQPTPQGNLAAFGTAANTFPGWTKSFDEHCVLLGLVCVRADLTYQQNIHRMFRRSTRWDFYWPSLAHLGEQAVLSEEIFSDGTADDQLVWGYQERYAEYRYKPSILTGLMRSKPSTSLDTWHLAQDFDVTRPLLNAAFIEENPPVDRCIAVTTEPHLLLDCWFQLNCVRPMPTYSVPGMIDHF